MEKPTSLDRMKKKNEKHVLRVVHENPGIYRKLIAAETDLASQTVTNLVTELIDKKILLEYSLSPGSRGRSPQCLTVNYGGFYILTAEITLRHVSIYLHSLDEKVLSSRRQRISEHQDVLQCLKDMIDHIRKHARRAERIQALVVSVTGVVNENTGTVLQAEKLGWYNLNLKEELSYLDIPVLVRNDVNLTACYEKARHKQDMNFMVAKIDVGIGSAFVLDSRVLGSTNSVAGELGHVTVSSPETRPCVCGKNNCLTKFISTEALEMTYGKSYDQLILDVEHREPKAVALIESVCTCLAPVLANIIILLDLDRVILCGCTVDHFTSIIAPCLDKKIREQLSYWVSFKGLEIHGPATMAAIGSGFWLDHFFSSEDAQFLTGEIPGVHTKHQEAFPQGNNRNS